MTLTYWITVALSTVFGFILALLAGYFWNRWFRK